MSLADSRWIVFVTRDVLSCSTPSLLWGTLSLEYKVIVLLTAAPSKPLSLQHHPCLQVHNLGRLALQHTTNAHLSEDPAISPIYLQVILSLHGARRVTLAFFSVEGRSESSVSLVESWSLQERSLFSRLLSGSPVPDVWTHRCSACFQRSYGPHLTFLFHSLMPKEDHQIDCGLCSTDNGLQPVKTASVIERVLGLSYTITLLRHKVNQFLQPELPYLSTSCSTSSSASPHNPPSNQHQGHSIQTSSGDIDHQKPQISAWKQRLLARHKHQCLFTLLLDCFLGLLLAKFAMSFISDFVEQFDDANIIHTVEIQIQNMSDHLRTLLKWMMGAPAGLKLNKTLAWFLGQFFMYHITIWQGYITFLLLPQLPLLLKTVPWMACGGVSLLMAILVDCCNICSLHFYCFYTYATKLCYLQVVVLKSVWRLFRGVKWNPLRNRIDHASTQLDRFIVSTLVLSLALFLLPTTAIFYLIFATIRLLMLLIEGILLRPINLFVNFPALPILRYLVGSAELKDEFVFSGLESSEGVLYLKMEVQSPSLSRIYSSYRSGEDSITGWPVSLVSLISAVINCDVV